MRVFGIKGEIYLEEKSCGVINVAYRDGSREHVTYTPERGYYNELLNFYNTLTGTENISVTPEIEYGDVKMVFDILHSIETKQPVRVDTATTGKDDAYSVYTNLYTAPDFGHYLQ